MRLMVWNRTPLAFPLRRMERFASVMPTLAQSSLAVMPRARSCSSRYTLIAHQMNPRFLSRRAQPSASQRLNQQRRYRNRTGKQGNVQPAVQLVQLPGGAKLYCQNTACTVTSTAAAPPASVPQCAAACAMPGAKRSALASLTSCSSPCTMPRFSRQAGFAPASRRPEIKRWSSACRKLYCRA